MKKFTVLAAALVLFAGVSFAQEKQAAPATKPAPAKTTGAKSTTATTPAKATKPAPVKTTGKETKAAK